MIPTSSAVRAKNLLEEYLKFTLTPLQEKGIFFTYKVRFSSEQEGIFGSIDPNTWEIEYVLSFSFGDNLSNIELRTIVYHMVCHEVFHWVVCPGSRTSFIHFLRVFRWDGIIDSLKELEYSYDYTTIVKVVDAIKHNVSLLWYNGNFLGNDGFHYNDIWDSAMGLMMDSVVDDYLPLSYRAEHFNFMGIAFDLGMYQKGNRIFFDKVFISRERVAVIDYFNGASYSDLPVELEKYGGLFPLLWKMGEKQNIEAFMGVSLVLSMVFLLNKGEDKNSSKQSKSPDEVTTCKDTVKMGLLDDYPDRSADLYSGEEGVINGDSILFTRAYTLLAKIESDAIASDFKVLSCLPSHSHCVDTYTEKPTDAQRRNFKTIKKASLEHPDPWASWFRDTYGMNCTFPQPHRHKINVVGSSYTSSFNVPHILMVIDESGTMNEHIKDVLTTFYSVVKGLRNLPPSYVKKTRITVASFSDKTRYIGTVKVTDHALLREILTSFVTSWQGGNTRIDYKKVVKIAEKDFKFDPFITFLVTDGRIIGDMSKAVNLKPLHYFGFSGKAYNSKLEDIADNYYCFDENKAPRIMVDAIENQGVGFNV